MARAPRSTNRANIRQGAAQAPTPHGGSPAANIDAATLRRNSFERRRLCIREAGASSGSPCKARIESTKTLQRDEWDTVRPVRSLKPVRMPRLINCRTCSGLQSSTRAVRSTVQLGRGNSIAPHHQETGRPKPRLTAKATPWAFKKAPAARKHARCFPEGKEASLASLRSRPRTALERSARGAGPSVGCSNKQPVNQPGCVLAGGGVEPPTYGS